MRPPVTDWKFKIEWRSDHTLTWWEDRIDENWANVALRASTRKFLCDEEIDRIMELGRKMLEAAGG